jgi:exodeoxyribonuclease VII large subunit
VGVVTSPTGAVIRDILHRLSERFPVRVVVWPVAVQGPGCAEAVAGAIRGFDALAPGGPVPRPDVLIVARGGGSIEDLWGFNEEAVVRAAAACTIPLVSAVGHETDTTLIDFAADRRAPTPTAAAEIAVPVRAELVAATAQLEARLSRSLRRGLDDRRRGLVMTARALPRPHELIELRRQRLAGLRLPDPRRAAADARARLDGWAARLAPGLRAAVSRGRLALAEHAARLSPRLVAERRREGAREVARLAVRLDHAWECERRLLRERLAGQARLLDSLDERQAQKRILGRGYAVVRDEDGALVTRAAQIRGGMALDIGFLDGQVQAVAGSATAPRRRSAARPGPREGAAQGSLFDAE